MIRGCTGTGAVSSYLPALSFELRKNIRRPCHPVLRNTENTLPRQKIVRQRCDTELFMTEILCHGSIFHFWGSHTNFATQISLSTLTHRLTLVLESLARSCTPKTGPFAKTKETCSTVSPTMTGTYYPPKCQKLISKDLGHLNQHYFCLTVFSTRWLLHFLIN